MITPIPLQTMILIPLITMRTIMTHFETKSQAFQKPVKMRTSKFQVSCLLPRMGKVVNSQKNYSPYYGHRQ